MLEEKMVLVIGLFIVILTRFEVSFGFGQKVPCFFIFGDSLVDNGNNNNLNTKARANYAPYGHDFPDGPTGRFTNGMNIADVIARKLGFKTWIPPFATAKDDDILTGVNYASGSAGILPETGKRLGENIFLGQQLEHHKSVVRRISNILGKNATEEHLGQCLYYFVIGSNDYLNNYCLPDEYNSSKIYNPDQYATLLIQHYNLDLEMVYSLGARKIGISGVGAVGCVPQELAKGTNGHACVSPINNAVQIFNKKLENLVKDLQDNYNDAIFAAIATKMFVPADLLSFGVRQLSKPCCKVSPETGLCATGNKPCISRGMHVYFDNFHLTQVVDEILGDSTYKDIKKSILDVQR